MLHSPSDTLAGGGVAIVAPLTVAFPAAAGAAPRSVHPTIDAVTITTSAGKHRSCVRLAAFLGKNQAKIMTLVFGLRETLEVLALEFLEDAVGEHLVGDRRDLLGVPPCGLARFAAPPPRQ